MLLAAHQPNLIPWLPFFRKIALSDKFVILRYVQFEKNGFQNRFNHKDKWMTMPVKSGLETLAEKVYVNGNNLVETNMLLIWGFCAMLGIDRNKIVFDGSDLPSGTDRLIELCIKHECDEYLTNPDAEQKYLDVKKMEDAGIKVIPFNPSSDYKISLFEAFEKWGIEGTAKMVNKKWTR